MLACVLAWLKNLPFVLLAMEVKNCSPDAGRPRGQGTSERECDEETPENSC